jgi:hypothetical protein
MLQLRTQFRKVTSYVETPVRVGEIWLYGHSRMPEIYAKAS